ncbi:MAG: D-sedoheptulose 7-phosphate isomerase [Geobacteraceae bacterium]|nr:D-sedoheptulose 7-phosphate isomerase [Geobacteraceae bacterium]
MIESIKAQFADHAATIETINKCLTDTISDAIVMIEDSLSSGQKLLIMGNGGSAADAQHFAAEIIGRFKMERRALPAIALTTDSSALTAIGNDYGFESVFSRQVEGLAAPGDVVFGISTSGNSPNVFAALAKGRESGCRTISLLGKDGGSIKDVSDISIIVPSHDTPRIQEGHITIIHIICDLLEKRLFKV